MIESKVVQKNGISRLSVGGKIIDSMAYMTYFTENARYEDFCKAGYSLFSVCTYFSDLPINEQTGFTPCRIGTYDIKGKADYSEFDNAVEELLKICPEAMIFPRVYVTMPLWWVKENPTEIISTTTTKEGREALFSEKFRHDGAALLDDFISHVESSPFADSIIGYQISGGSTQEWIYFGSDGGCGASGGYHENALPYFKKYLTERSIEADTNSLPTLDLIDGKYSKSAQLFYRFLNDEAAKTVGYLAKTAKTTLGGKKIIGVFYGYTVEILNPGRGTQSLETLIDSPYIDFFSSPISYFGTRALGIEWCDMLPKASVLSRGKLYMTEADVRTHFSDYPELSRPDCKIVVPYRGAVWKGGTDSNDDILHLRKAFAKCLCENQSFWWFDMWGGWYACQPVMEEMAKFRKIMSDSDSSKSFRSLKVAVFVDETVYSKYANICRPRADCLTIAQSGLPYDVYILSDFESVASEYSINYALLPESNERAKKIKAFAEYNNLPFVIGIDFKPADIKNHLKQFNITPVSKTDDIIYIGNGYITIHATTGGTKTLDFPCLVKLTPVIGDAPALLGSLVTFDAKQYQTVVFKIDNQ